MLLDSDISDINDWDSESEAGVDEAAKMLALCPHDSTPITFTQNVATTDPILVVDKPPFLGYGHPRQSESTRWM